MKVLQPIVAFFIAVLIAVLISFAILKPDEKNIKYEETISKKNESSLAYVDPKLRVLEGSEDIQVDSKSESASVIIEGRFNLPGHRADQAIVLMSEISRELNVEKHPAIGTFIIQMDDLPYPIRLERSLTYEGKLVERMDVANHTLIRLKEGSKLAVFEKLVGSSSLFRRIKTISPSLNIYLLEHQELALDAAINMPVMLETQYADHLMYAETDPVVHTLLSPNDPDYLSGELWGLNNTSQNAGLADADIDAPEAWDFRNSASSTIVGVIDTGILYTHEDLADNMWVNLDEIPGNGLDDDSNGYVDDIHGINAIADNGNPKDDNSHGSHVAGTIGATGNNGLGITGVAWDVQLMGLKFLSSSGNGAISDAVECLDYARMMGAHITNSSWGGSSSNQALADSMVASAEADMIFVTAAGNSTADNDSNANFPSNTSAANIVTVASTTRNDRLSSFSNYGFGTVHIAAPGSDIWSIEIEGNDAYGSKSGTSMASPHVAGVLALLREEYPSDSPGQLINRLLRGGDPIEEVETSVHSGRRLNLLGALLETNSSPINDDFSEAITIPTSNARIQMTFSNATAETSNIMDGIADGNAIWYKINFGADGRAILELLEAEFDLSIGLYTGDSIENLAEAPRTEGDQDSLNSFEFTVEADTDYYVALSAEPGASGFFSLFFGGPPENDLLSTATDLRSKAPIGIDQLNRYTSKEPEEADHGGEIGGSSVWFKWDSPGTRTYTLTTGGVNSLSGGSNIDTLLAVYTGPEENPQHEDLNLVAFNDNAEEGGLFSTLTFDATSQTTYYFVVDGKNAAEGKIRLGLFPTPSNDDLSNATLLEGDTINIEGNLMGSTVEPGEPNHGGSPALYSVWYNWIPASSGDFLLDTSLSGSVQASMPTSLAVYTGDDINNLNEIASDPDGSDGRGYAITSFSAIAGTSYRIAVSSDFVAANSDSSSDSVLLGPFGLNIQQFILPQNDDFEDATEITGILPNQGKISVSGNNLSSTSQPGEPIVSNNFGAKTTVWWKWTATTNERVELDTKGSDFDTHLEVFTGSSFATLDLVVSDDDSGGSRTSALNWTPINGENYYIRVSGYNNADGQIQLNLGFYEPNPYDQFANAFEIVPNFIYVPYPQGEATMEAGEPSHGGIQGVDRSIWFQFTPDETNASSVTFSSMGSRQNIVVAVYTGTSIQSLTEVVSNNEFGGRNDGQVTWSASEGTTYYIAVANAIPEQTDSIDDYLISFVQTPNDDFANATPLLGDSPQIESHNFGASKELNEPQHTGNGGGRSVWFDWTPDTSGFYEISTEGSNSRYQHSGSVKSLDTLLAIYSGDSISSLTTIASNDDEFSSGKDIVNSAVFVDVTGGETYRIAVDGYREDGQADWGIIHLSINPYIVPENDELSQAEALTGPFNHILSNNSGTTISTGEPVHAGNSTRSKNTLWYTFIPPESKQYHVSAGGNFYNDFRVTDTVVAVYTSDILDPDYIDLVPLASDSSDSAFLTTHTSFEAVAGKRYYIVLGSKITGPTSLIVAESPQNDSIVDAKKIYGSSFSVSGYNVGAQADPGEESPISFQSEDRSDWRSVWWRWTAPATGDVELDTYHSDLWVLLSIYEDAPDIESLSGSIFSNDGLDGINLTVTGERDFADRRRRGTVITTFPATAGQTYLFRLSGTGFRADHVGTIQLDLAGPLGPPPAPLGFFAKRINDTQVELSWEDLSSDEENYTIESRENGSDSWTLLAVTGADFTSYVDSSASLGSLEYRIKATNTEGDSDWTTYLLEPKNLSVPTNFEASSSDAKSIELSWEYGSAINRSETGFEIQRSLDGTVGSFSTVALVSANTLSFTDSELSSSTEYVYRIRSFNEFTESGWSFYAVTTTWDETYIIDSPTTGYHISRIGDTPSASLTQMGETQLRHFTGGTESDVEHYASIWNYFPKVNLADGESLSLEINFSLINSVPNAGQTLRFGLLNSNGSQVEIDTEGSNNPDHRDDSGYGFMLATGSNTTSRYHVEAESAVNSAPLTVESSILGDDPKNLSVNDLDSHTIKLVYTRSGNSLQFDAYLDESLYDSGRTIASPISFEFDMLWIVHRIENQIWELNSAEVIYTHKPVSLNPSERWRLSEFGQIDNSGDAADSANPDNDDYSNLLERALGLDPNRFDSIDLFEVYLSTVDGVDYWHFSTQRNPFASDLNFTVLSSADLINWSEDDTVRLEDDGEKLTVRSLFPRPVDTSRFFRLLIEEK